MSAHEPSRIQKSPDICFGKARIRDTRIPVFLLILSRLNGQPDAVVLDSYPSLTQEDLDAAWRYYQDNPVEIEQTIWYQDTAGNVPEGVAPSAEIIVAGRLLGLDHFAIREAFDPPLSQDAIDAAWADYRADPLRIGRSLAALRRVGKFVASLLADENFADQVVFALIALGHDAVTARAVGLRQTPDPLLLTHATADRRVVLTYDRDYHMLHRTGVAHAGIVFASPDPDFAALAGRIDVALAAVPNPAGQLFRVVRPSNPKVP